MIQPHRRRPAPRLRSGPHARPACRDRALQSSTAFYGVSWNSPQVPVPSRLVFTEAYGHILTSTHMFGTFPGHRKRTTDLSWHARSEIADWKAAVRDCACRSRRSPTPRRPSPAASGSYTGATPAQEAGSSKRPTGMGATWTKAFAVADDFEDADGGLVLSYFQASDIARRLARGGAHTTDS